MGRNKFSQREIQIIEKLLKRKCEGTRFQQKQIRHQLRVNFEFSISDFGEQGKAFGPEELQDALKRGAIQILDDATIEAMKERRRLAREKDEAAEAAAAEADVKDTPADWKKAMAEWEEWEKKTFPLTNPLLAPPFDGGEQPYRTGSR